MRREWSRLFPTHTYNTLNTRTHKTQPNEHSAPHAVTAKFQVPRRIPDVRGAALREIHSQVSATTSISTQTTAIRLVRRKVLGLVADCHWLIKEFREILDEDHPGTSIATATECTPVHTYLPAGHNFKFSNGWLRRFCYDRSPPLSPRTVCPRPCMTPTPTIQVSDKLPGWDREEIQVRCE